MKLKLKLNKTKLKNLSKDNKVLPVDMTPQVGGGVFSVLDNCQETWECTVDETLDCPVATECCPVDTDDCTPTAPGGFG